MTNSLFTALLMILPGPSATSIERHFRYPPSDLTTRWKGDSVEVSFRRGTPEVVPGRPCLPLVAERIDLPAGMRVRSISVKQAKLEPLAPSGKVRRVPALPTDVDALGRPRVAPGPAEAPALDEPTIADLGYQGAMRGKRLAWLLVRPVRWSPASGALQQVTDLDVQVELEPDLTSEVVTRERVVPDWEEGAAAITATIPKRAPQPFKPTQLPSVLGSPVAYVIVTSDALVPQFQRLADWKTQAGIPAVVRSMTTIRQEYPGTDDADRVRRFIRDAYSSWGTKWVLLGGDTPIIPTRTAWTKFYTSGIGADTLNDIPTDLYFSCLDGNWNADGDSLDGEGEIIGGGNTIIVDNCDLLPEVWVGRAPVSTVAEAQLFVDKVFQYSRTPVGDYEKNVLFMAEVMDPESWHPGDFIYLDGAALVEECLPYVKSNLSMRYGRLYENYLEPSYEPGALQLLRRAALDSLRAGYNMAIHCGHGFRNVMSLGDSSIGNADAMALTNGNRLTNFYAVDCTSNAIDFPCLGEALMKASNGGAVSNVGSTRLDFPSTGRAYQREFFKLVFQDSVSAVGEAQGRQKLPFVPNSKNNNSQRWTQMTLLLLGDPEMHLWTGKPRTLQVTKAASMPASDTTFAVHVTIGGVPLYGARVTAYKAGDDYASALTDGAGNVTLDFRPDGAGTFTLTVTGYDCVPYQASVPITSASVALLVEGAIGLDDDNIG